jgi:TonB-linked SusC/RagA family outer membrane protein
MFKSLLLKGRTLCLLLCCMVSSLVVTAQTKHTGKVIGADDKLPVVGASIRIKGTNTGTVTDVNGDFTLSLSPGNVLVVSYIGYVTQEVTVTSADFVTISLAPSASTLNEVVVTGYQTQLKKDISGSIATVDVTDAKKVPVTSSEELLQGQASGVTVINSGAPGAASTVFIRGIANFGNTTPLYVIDGVQTGDMSLVNPSDIESISVLKDAGAAAIYGISGGNGVIVVTTKKGKAGKSSISYNGFYGVQQPLSGNVWHIENPEQQSQLAYLANDKPTEALYPGGPGTIDTYGYHGTNAPAGAGASFGVAGVTNSADIVNYYNFDAANPGNDYLVQKFASGAGNDWFHDVFTAEPTMQHTITATGGNGKSTYLMALNYVNQTGTLLSTYEKRYQVRVNTTTSALNNHLRFGENGFVTYRENNGGYNGSEQNEGGIIAETFREDPIIPVYDVSGKNFGGGYDGPLGEPLGNGSNPYADAYRATTAEGANAHFVYVEGNVFAEADITKYITFRTQIAGNLYNQYYWNLSYNTYENFESHGSANGNSENEQLASDYIWTNTATYKQSFGKHNLTVFAGYEQKQNAGRGFTATNQDLFSLDPNYVTLGAGSPVDAPTSYIVQPTTTESFFGRVDYNYNDRYILGLTARNDKFSNFAPGHQSAVFPAVSAAWRISQEDFMKGINWINDLKIIGSYGEAGNDGNETSDYIAAAYATQAGYSNYAINGGNSLQQGFYNTGVGNIKTSWETDKITNIGFTASLFNHLDLDIEWYKKAVSGLLFAAPIPATLGGASVNPPTINVGDVQNKGLDMSATYHDRVSQDVTFSIGANITTYKSLITHESNNSTNFQSGFVGGRIAPTVLDQVGEPIGEFYGYQVTGIYQNPSQVSSLPGYTGAVPGSFIYKDVDGDGKITSNDQTFIGNPNPDFTYGVNLSATWKRFDFSMVLYGSQGNKDFNFTKFWTDFYSTFQGAKSIALLTKSAINSDPTDLAAGTISNPSATVPSAAFANSMGGYATSSYYVENGSFLKCRVLQVGYSFAPQLLQNIGIEKLHVYGQVTNLFTITKYDGLDPELVPSLNQQGNGGSASAAFGIDLGAYPNNQRQIIFGLDLTFN